MQPQTAFSSQESSLLSVLFLLIPWCTMFACCLDLFIPAIPAIASDLHMTVERVQSLQSVFMLCLGFGMLVIGPLSDMLGHYRVIHYAMFSLITGHLIGFYSIDYHLIIFARVLEAFGSASILLIAYACARNFYSVPFQTQQLISYLNGSVGLCWIILPGFTSIFLSYFSWRYIFILLTITTCFSLIYTQYYFKGRSKSLSDELFNWDTLKAFLHNPNTYFYGLGCCVTQATCFTFTVQAPIILLHQLKISYFQFSLDFSIIALSFSLSNFYFSALTKYLSTKEIVLTSSLIIMFGGCLMSICYLMLGLTHLGFLIPMMMIILGSGLMCSSALWGAIQPFKTNMGSIMAILGSARFLFSSLIALLSSFFGFSVTSISWIAILLGLSLMLSDILQKKQIIHQYA